MGVLFRVAVVGLGAASALWGSWAEAAQGQISALGRSDNESSVALAGDAVLVADGGYKVRTAIRSLPLARGPSRRLFSFRASARRRVGLFDLDGSGERAAFTLGTVTRDVDESPRGFSVFSGLPARPFARLLSASYTVRNWFAVGVQVDGPRLLVTEIRHKPRGVRHTMYSPGSAPVVLSVGRAFDVRLAGPLIAYPVALPKRRGEERARLVVADWRTGKERYHVDDIDADGFDLAPDGRLVSETPFGSRSRLVIADGRGPPRRFLRDSPGVSAGHLSPRLAGGLVVVKESGAEEGNEFVAVISPADGRLRRLSPTSAEIGDVDVEGDRVVWVANGCVLVGSASVRGSRTIPPGPCPRSEVFLESGQNATLRRRRVRAVVACLSAEGRFCRGRASLRVSPRGSAVGTARFKIRRGRKASVRLKLSRTGLRAVLKAFAEEDGSALLSVDAVAIDSRGRRSRATHGIGVALPGVDPL